MSNLRASPKHIVSLASIQQVVDVGAKAWMVTLSPGLYCAYQIFTVDKPVLKTSFPYLRFDLAPGVAGRTDAVDIVTIPPSDTLAEAAALIRVITGEAQIVVTVYDHGLEQDSSHFGILQLNDAASPPVETVREKLHARPHEVMVHIQRIGDVSGRLGEWLGQSGSGLWVEGFGIKPDGIALEEIEYQAVLGHNWFSPWVTGGVYCGSRGMSLPLLGFCVRLKGATAKNYSCTYNATFVDGSRVGPVTAGTPCVTTGSAAVESIRISIGPIGVPE